jgi:hypothetical protein
MGKEIKERVMKNGIFEIGDEVECVNATSYCNRRKEQENLIKGQKYIISQIMVSDVDTLSRFMVDGLNRWFYADRFKLAESKGAGCPHCGHYCTCKTVFCAPPIAEPDTPEDFTYEYFSALNEKEAEVYIGRTMEFADRRQLHENKWEQAIFLDIAAFNAYSFRTQKGTVWHFMRTCPETFQKKMVKKVVEVWAAMFKEGGHAGFYARKSGAEKAWPDLDYVKLTGEYEVEE